MMSRAVLAHAQQHTMASTKMPREAAASGEVEFSVQTLAKAQSSAGARPIHVSFVPVDPTLPKYAP